MTIAIAVCALAVAILALAVSGWQLREAIRANTFPGAVDLFREFRTTEMTQARAVLREALKGQDPKGGIRGLHGEAGMAARRVSHYLDQLGVLVENDLLKPKLAAGFLGATIIEMWLLPMPFIDGERALGPVNYQRYFESLAVALDSIDPGRAVAHLPRWPR